MHVLILGGTTEARRLAQAVCDARPEWRVTTSLAGRVARPLLPVGEVRTGGFGGADGLARALRELHVDALIDATHPFAGTISFHAATAATEAHVPLLALRRPGWVPTEGDNWHRVASLEDAATSLPALGRRAFLTVGRQGVPAFASVDDVFFLVRAVDPPEPPLPGHTQVLLSRGPFTLEDERALLQEHQIDVLVTKDAGGSATSAKLVAAREAGIPVIVVERPPVLASVQRVGSVAEVMDWLGQLSPWGSPRTESGGV
ncbi:cobalt-precorrin-6A reductase [Streptomyces sp. NPDC046821]|uniref:cobalt-precorrin-6A reductase n=1 Tax=Streptomyces sp. NPDC046821 TaxID=3154702 RepID=UPI00340B9FE7